MNKKELRSNVEDAFNFGKGQNLSILVKRQASLSFINKSKLNLDDKIMNRTDCLITKIHEEASTHPG